MEYIDPLNTDESLDPEAEMAARLKDADDIIFPAILERLNVAKVDYNLAASPYTDRATKLMLANKYLEMIQKFQSTLGVRVAVLRDVCIKRPKLALSLDHSARLTIDWLLLINNLQVSASVPNFVPWANLVIGQEQLFLKQIKSVTDEQEAMGFAKNRPEA